MSRIGTLTLGVRSTSRDESEKWRFNMTIGMRMSALAIGLLGTVVIVPRICIG
jgi:hypothetical protein